MFGKSKKVEFKFDLGSRVEDITCGFTGIITQRTQCLNGCIQYTVTPKVKKDGERADAWSIDEAQLRLIDEGVNKKVETKEPKFATGGPATRVRAQ